MTLPRWLRDRLGTPTRGRGCRATKCIVCRGDVLAGFDEDQCAALVIADPTPLSPLGEALALIEGRRSYRLERYKDGAALWFRSHWQIQGAPASTETIVLTDHKCGAPQLPGVEITPIPAAKMKTAVLYDDPPF